MVGTIGNILGGNIENFGEHIDNILWEQFEKLGNILRTQLGSNGELMGTPKIKTQSSPLPPKTPLGNLLGTHWEPKQRPKKKSNPHPKRKESFGIWHLVNDMGI